MTPKCLRVVADERILWTIGEEERQSAEEPSSRGKGDGDAAPTTTTTSTSISSTLTAGAFLTSSRAGAYTTARTSAGGTRVFDLTRHIERLSSSASLLGEGGGGGGGSGDERAPPPPPLPPPPRSLSDASLLRPRVLSLLRLGLLGDEHGSVPDPALKHRGEFRVTILACWTGEEEEEEGEKDEGKEGAGIRRRSPFSLSLHVAPLPPPPHQPVSALILRDDGARSASSRGGRSRAAAKSTGWVGERAALEAAGRAAGADEVLLVEEAEEGEEEEEEEAEERGGGEGKRRKGGLLVLEGLSSNFAAVVPLLSSEGDAATNAAAAAAAADGHPLSYGTGFELQTAGEGRVLAGTIRALLVEVASRAGLLVSASRRPSVEDARASLWAGCLLLSTSRLALPVAELRELQLRGRKEGKEDDGDGDGDEGGGEKGSGRGDGGATSSSSSSLVASFRDEGGRFHPVVERLSREVAAAVEGASESIILSG